MMRARPIVIGVGIAAAVAGTASIGAIAIRALSGAAVTDAAKSTEKKDRKAASVTGSICLKPGAEIVQGLSPGCHSPAVYADHADSAILDARGAPVAVMLEPPKGSAEPRQASTCREYRALAAEGWFALSGADMRREAFFRRACGALSALEEARPAEHSDFAGESLGREDVAALLQASAFRIGPTEGESGARQIDRQDANAWRFSAGGQIGRLQEIAHADFTGDGRGDMLVFVAMRVEDGTAGAASVGIVVKDGPDAPARYIARD